MTDNSRLLQECLRPHGGIVGLLNTFPGEVRLNLWTSLTPEEIATEFRPFLAGEAAPWNPGPKLLAGSVIAT